MAVYTIGEALIDMMPEGEAFLPAVGGAPANVAACVAKLNSEAFFIGTVGDDLFGEKTIRELSVAGVNIRYINKTAKANTALAFVTLGADGAREFSFYRKPSADMFLAPEDAERITFKKGDILHFCSVDLIDMPVRYATMRAIEKCKADGGIISFDPNIRLSLWDDKEEYKRVILEFLPLADIAKLADDEIAFLFGNVSIDSAAEIMLKTAAEAIITLGKNGSLLYTAKGKTIQKPYKINAVDTTGAGDSFIGTYLRYRDALGVTALEYASAASAMVCLKKGVLPALPTESELQEFINSKR